MNNLLRGDMQELKEAAADPEKLNNRATELLLSSCLAISGLNRADNYIMPGYELKRTEGSLPETVKNRRLGAINELKTNNCIVVDDCAAKGLGVTRENNFISTSMRKSNDKPMDSCFKTDKYYSSYGANITSLAKIDGEEEFLIPPAYIQWLSVKYTQSKYGDECTHFVGKAVRHPYEDASVVEAYAAFKNFDADIAKLIQYIERDTVDGSNQILASEAIKLRADIEKLKEEIDSLETLQKKSAQIVDIAKRMKNISEITDRDKN